MHIQSCLLASISLLLPHAVGQKANCTHPTQFFDQKIDHALGNSSTFPQQFQVISDYYNPGGPILFYQGAENSVMTCLEDSVLPFWAERLGALCLAVEHRFFGDSVPSNSSNVLQRYQSLTLENVLADNVELIAHVKASTPSLKDAKVIVQGGMSCRTLLVMTLI